jgi:DNA-binding MarR family transcriptional regulator
MASPATTPKLAFAGVVAGATLGVPVLRRAGAAALIGSAALALETASNEPVPGASDNATGVAGVLALAERFATEPLPGTEVVVLLPGCEESGMGGMAAWLGRNGRLLDPGRTLVLGLDTIGSGIPVVLRAEGGLWPVRYRERDVLLAERAAARAEQEHGPCGYLIDDSGVIIGPMGPSRTSLTFAYREHGAGLEELAKQAGLSAATLSRLAALEQATNGRPIAPSDLADALGITDPSGRRLIRKLVAGGLVTQEGTQQQHRKGRPTRLYQLGINAALARKGSP